MNDNILLQLLKFGSHDAFIEIFDRYHNVCFSSACDILKNRELAIDAVQEIFMSVWNERETIDDLKMFILIKAKDVILDYIKKR